MVMNLELCRLTCVLSTSSADCPDDSPLASRSGEVHLASVRCCDHYEVIVLGLVDHRLLVRYALRDNSGYGDEDGLSFVVPLPEEELGPMTAMDLSEDAEYLAVVAEDASLLVVPLLELLCMCTPSWADRIEAHRAAPRSRPRLVTRDRGALDLLVDLLGTSATAQLLGSVAPALGEPVTASALRFRIDALQNDDATITSCVWWTRDPTDSNSAGRELVPAGAVAGDGEETTETHHPQFYLITGSLSGQLTIIDVMRQTEVRCLHLAPIVYLQRCRSGHQEWLLIETGAEPKHWKLLLATTIERKPGGEQPLRWSIIDGVALPTSASLHFELEPLSGLPSCYHQLHVLSRSRGGGGDVVDATNFSNSSSACVGSDSEVLGILVTDEEPTWTDEEPNPLCLLLSLPSIPEEPLAKVDLPVSASPPGVPGQRRFADVLLLLGGGVVLSVVHVGSGSNEQSTLVLSTAKPRPCTGGHAIGEPSNSVFQELTVPGHIIGGVAGYSSWTYCRKGLDNDTGLEACDVHDSGDGTVAPELGGVGVVELGTEAAGPSSGSANAVVASSRPLRRSGGGAQRDRSGHEGDDEARGAEWTTLAIVWTLTDVFVVSASPRRLCATLQAQSLRYFVEGPARETPRATPRGEHQARFPSTCMPEIASEYGDVGLDEQFEAVLPHLCWAFDVDLDDLMLSAGDQALATLNTQQSDVSVARRNEDAARAVRATLSLWARRSTKLVPLPLLMECFGQLMQDVEVVRLTAPAMLQVLMPHWPSVAVEMEAFGNGIANNGTASTSKPAPPFFAPNALSPSDGGAIWGAVHDGTADDTAHVRGAPSEASSTPAGLGPSVVAWFLSLAVMLLVVMHPRTVAARGVFGEYTRRKNHDIGVPGPSATGRRDFTTEWQAWVSEHVTLMLVSSANKKPPANFALFADEVQQEFEDWWNREWRTLQENRANQTAMSAPPSPALSITSPEATLLQSSNDMPSSTQRLPITGSSKMAAVEVTTPASSPMPCSRPWSSRLLLLATLLRNYPSDPSQQCDSAECPDSEASEWHTVGVTSLTSHLAEASAHLRKDLPIGLAEATLLATMLHGLELTAYPPESGRCGTAFTCHRAPGHAACALALLLAFLAHFASSPAALAAEGSWRILWSGLSTLRSALVAGAPAAGTAGASGQSAAPPQAIAARLEAPLDVLLQGDLLPHTADTPDGIQQGSSLHLLPWLVRAPNGEGDCGLLKESETLLKDEPGGGKVFDHTFALLDALDLLFDWGPCVSCDSEWCWERDDGAEVSLIADEASSASSTAGAVASTSSISCRDAFRVLRGLERWLLKHAALPPGACCEEFFSTGGHSSSTCQSTDISTTTSSDAVRGGFGEVNRASPEFVRLVAQAAAVEEARCDSGADGGERLGRVPWWPQLHARLLHQTESHGSPVLVVLSVMAAEHPWVWALPWTGELRLRMSHALYAARTVARVHAGQKLDSDAASSL